MQCGLGASSQASGPWASCLQRQRGRGGRPEDSRSATALSSLFALQWFSHQTRLLNQRPLSTKTANYVQMRCPPPCPFRVPSRVLSFSTRFYLASTLFSLALATYFSRSQSNGKTPCYISDLLLVSVQLSLGPSEEWRKAYKGFVFGDGNCNCSWGVKLASHGYCGFLCFVC